MRLLELRLIEDHGSTVRFPGNLTVVAGLSKAARSWFVTEVPALLNGERSSAAAFVDVAGVSREVSPAVAAVSFSKGDAAMVLDGAPFAQAMAPSTAPFGSIPPVVITEEQLERARTVYESSMQNLRVLERSVELSRAEHRGALVTREDLVAAASEAGQAIDPIALTVRDRSLEIAGRLEVETGALPGVCRGETHDGVRARIARLEAVLFELDSALNALQPVDGSAVEHALDLMRVITATGPIEVPEAIRLADDYRSLRSQIAALEERVAVDEGGMASVNDRLDHARARFAAAETKLLPAHVDAGDITALETAHDMVLEAEKRVSGLFGGRSRKLLDDALAEEQIVLDRLGFPTWSAFIMGARMLDSTAENKRQLELARRELEDAERVWARVMEKLEENPEFYAYLDRLERLQEAAHAIVGDVDDVEGALRQLRVDPGPATMTVDAARDQLAASLVDVGFGIETHATLDDLQEAARVWLDDVREISRLHAQIALDAKHCAQELEEAREASERIEVVGAVDQIDGFGADRLHAARAAAQRADERLWAHRGALIRSAQLVAESERVIELEAQLAAELATKEELLGITRELADATAAKLSLFEAAIASRDTTSATADDAADAATDDARHHATPDRIEALTEILEQRITALRAAGVDGSLPLVLDDAFAGLAPTERAELLGWLEGYSLFLQIIYLADGPEVVAWAEGRPSARTRVTRGEGFFAAA